MIGSGPSSRAQIALIIELSSCGSLALKTSCSEIPGVLPSLTCRAWILYCKKTLRAECWGVAPAGAVSMGDRRSCLL
ncbi:MAG: hypothetical protein V3T05_03710 [Myxococcota bacterium]